MVQEKEFQVDQKPLDVEKKIEHIDGWKINKKT